VIPASYSNGELAAAFSEGETALVAAAAEEEGGGEA
jgi:hypothetical protein